MAIRHTNVLASALVIAAAGAALAAGDWSAVKSKVDDAKRQVQELARLVPAETRGIVKEMCEADDEHKKSAAESAAYRARDHVRDKYRDTERAMKDAVAALERVHGDDDEKEHRSDAASLQSELKSQWEKVEDRTRPLRDGRPPVIDYVLSRSTSARSDRADRCDLRDAKVGWDKVDCMMARGETCEVVALTSDTHRAISAGHDRARKAVRTLEDELKRTDSDVIKHLVQERSSFAKCKRFEARVDCFKLCPEVDDDGRHRESGPSWREGC